MDVQHDNGTDVQSVESLLTSLEDRRVPVGGAVKQTFATGMDPLDQVLGGGVRVHDVTLVGGAPGIGKTIATLQWARHIALAGGTAMYVCYEHDHAALLTRLMGLELGMMAEGESRTEVDKLQIRIKEAIDGLIDLRTVLDVEPLARVVLERVQSYAPRLNLVRASGRHSTVAALEELAASQRGTPSVMFVDYLQKIPVVPEPANEAEKVTLATERLKELALSYDVAVIAIVAAGNAGLESQRLRLHHLRGSSALAYESDVVILLNDKHKIVAKAHLAYDLVKAAQYHHQVVFTVEKNRHGAAPIDLEFRKDFGHYRFDPRGGFPPERLVDERVNEA